MSHGHDFHAMAYLQSNSKVAIPKLDRKPPPRPKPPAQSREDRATRACKVCRKRKVKCSGEIPRCANCQTNGLNCIYEQARRDRLKEAIDLNHTFIALFNEVSIQLTEKDRRKIQDVIDAAEDDLLYPQTPQPGAASIHSLGKRVRKSPGRGSPGAESPTKKHGEAHVTGSVGSNEDLDYLDEDLLRTRESRETGYVGQNSEVQWLRSIQRQSQNQEGEPYGLPYGPPGTSDHASDERSKALHQRRQEGGFAPIRHVTDPTFYLDSDNIDLDVVVNPYELPDPEIAEQLLDCYLRTVHTTFPIVPSSFEDQVRRFIASQKQNRAFHVPDRWRALMNLILAIGAKYSHLTSRDWRGDQRDHLVYMTRASHLLGMNSTVMFLSAPDLSLVQATAVFSLYFLAIGHVSRAWLMVGVSIRLALALGLHLRNEDPGADGIKKEMLLRTWWSLHSIECLVSSITGRPPIISNEDCTVPLPQVLPEERPPSKRQAASSASQKSPQTYSPSNSSSNGSENYLASSIKIALLTQRVLASLYAPRTAGRSWQNVQNNISELLQNLEEWSSHALGGAVSPSASQHSELEREHLLLLIHYWSTKILITRPCLCRTERRIKNESDTSAAFNSEMASMCVKSARELTGLFPQTPDFEFVYMKAPWWNVVHIIMQCAAVLLLELGYQSRHTKDNNARITADIQKLLSWLHVMEQNDPVAERAYHVVRRILQNVAPVLQSKAAELLTEGPAVDEVFRPGVTPHKESGASLTWTQGDVLNGSGSVAGHQLYPQGVHYNYFDTPQAPQDDSMYGNYLLDLQIPSAFGNPFVNSWDEQNIWYNSRFPAHMPEDLSDTQLYPNSYAEPQHQQQQQYQRHVSQQPSESASPNAHRG